MVTDDSEPERNTSSHHKS